jgi:hypothetical protein
VIRSPADDRWATSGRRRAARTSAARGAADLPGDDSDDGSLRARDRVAEQAYAERSAGAKPAQAVAIATEMARDRREGEAVEPAIVADVRAGDPRP